MRIQWVKTEQGDDGNITTTSQGVKTEQANDDGNIATTSQGNTSYEVDVTGDSNGFGPNTSTLHKG